MESNYDILIDEFRKLLKGEEEQRFIEEQPFIEKAPSLEDLFYGYTE
jgi:hypothetical protein